MSAASRFRRGGLALTLALLAAGCATGGRTPLAWPGGDEPALETWFEQELEPYVTGKLTTHPRFRGETVTVATMQGDEPRPATDSLSRALAQRLNQSLLSTPGVNVVWDGGGRTGDCVRREDAHYVLAVDLQQTGPASHRLAVRALDREDGLWVSGFGLEWNGRLSRAQYARFREPAVTEETRGLRAYPFAADEGDLLAERLAAKLGAQFCGFVGEPLVVFADTADQPAFVADTLRLVASNLARSPDIRAASARSDANLLLSARLYEIDGDLHQFWVEARPAGTDARFPVTDVEAYVRAPRRGGTVVAARAERTGAADRPRTALRDGRGDSGVAVEAMRILTPNDLWMCRRADPWRRGASVLRAGRSLPHDACFALEVEVRGDAEVFLLRRDAGAGLVRMMPARCGRHGTVASRTYGDATLRFPAAPGGWEHALRPPRSAVTESWIAVAVPAGDPGARLRRHLGRLPDTCAAADGASVDADAWLVALAELAATSAAVRRLDVTVGRQAARRD
ncbi:MAG: hypothetical protein P8172_08030 [Gammaproteobacteria bacterium]